MRTALRVIDSHTGGEPTRLVIDGGPDLGSGPLAERRERFRDCFDQYRSAIVNEPRGSDALVGALLVEAQRSDCDFGVIFFNNVGFLGMCGHGTIGVIESLRFSGRLAAGSVRIDTPVGPVQAHLGEDGAVSLDNVTSYRATRGLDVEVPGAGRITGDVAWGGNWFFLVSDHGGIIDLAHVEPLTEFSRRVRAAVNAGGHPEVDHVELFGPASFPGAHSRNFVLCPGNAYDRSPCGTGTSAKLACLAADGKLEEGDEWVQESLIGSTFSGRYRWSDRTRGEIVPTITGRAHVTGEGSLHVDPNDPFGWGINGASRTTQPGGGGCVTR
jgi:4-hydroxyproline epimerase